MTYGTGLTPPSGDQGYQHQYASSLAQPQWGQPAAIQQAVAPPMNPYANEKVFGRGRSVPWWLFAILGVILLWVISYFSTALGQGASTLGFIVALIPLGIVIIGVYLIDRWEPEPLRLLIFALLWGAIASIALTLLVVSATDPYSPTQSGEAPFFEAVIRAPLVEELTKGIGLLIIMVVGKRALDGPIDGIVYGALIGAGFAFTENIQYFAIQFLDYGSEGVASLFFLRGIMSPFCHAMFTGAIGFAVGIAARKGQRGMLIPMFLVGYAAGVLLHAWWNGSTFIDNGQAFFTLYFVTQVPLFVIFIVAIAWLRREEARLTRKNLGDYAMAGWFTPQEVDMLATPKGRSGALAWARTLPGGRKPVMKKFIRDANALAATRQRAMSGRDPQAPIDEHILLQRTMNTRAMLLSR